MMTRSKKIFVTGSTGLVGGHLVAELLRCGYSHIVLPVRSLQSLEKLYKTLRREGVEWNEQQLKPIEVALNNPIELDVAMNGVDMVFHCAAMVALGGSQEDTMIRTNVEITQHVVNSAINCGVRRLVHVSSIATLGEPLEGAKYSDETTSMETLTGVSAYSVSKFFSENEIVRGKVEGLQTVIVNPSAIIGAGDWSSGSAVMIPVLSRGLSVYTEGVTGYVDVRDVARAMVLLAQSDKASGEKFILSSENLSYRELISMANGVIGKPTPRFRVGRRLLSMAWRGASAWSAITGRASIFTKDVARIMLNQNYYNGDKIKKYITFDYTPLSETIERVVKQYLDDKSGKDGDNSSSRG